LRSDESCGGESDQWIRRTNAGKCARRYASDLAEYRHPKKVEKIFIETNAWMERFEEQRNPGPAQTSHKNPYQDIEQQLGTRRK
jgi:hypothetical protein